MDPIDDIDKRIINRIQSEFPICRRPYAAIADELGMTEADVLSRIRTLKEKGIIRRIGGNFRPEKLGFFSTLCAAEVPDEVMDTFTACVNAYPGVTHNYVRDNRYNIWFTFIAPSREEINRALEDIRLKTGARILNLPASHMFKISAQFTL
ncbi:siroheme decarboxylase subunit alpha [Desulfatiferula olefinivorans]